MVLAEFGMQNTKWELLDVQENVSGTRRLTFAAFRLRFPTFPVVLDAKYLGRVGERVRLVHLFRRPDHLFLTDLYSEALARHADEAIDRPVGLVIPFDGYRGGFVLHNGAFATDGKQFQFSIPKNASPYRLTVEPFPQLLSYLAASAWSPATETGVQLQANQASTCGVPTVLVSWMVRRLGTGPALVLYLFLTGVLASSSSRHQEYIRRGKSGGRYLAMTHEELTKESGLSPDAVKSGLRRLKTEHLAQTRRGDRRTYFFLAQPDE